MPTIHRRIASRLRFREYLTNFRSGLKRTDLSPPDPAKTAPKHRSLGQLYRELYRLLIGYRFTLAMALAALSLGTLLKLIPPAATKAAIDYVMLGHPVPDWVAAWSPVSIPTSPRTRLVWLVGIVMTVSVLGKFLGLSSRWQATRTTKRVQVAVRRKVYEHAMRLPLHRVYQLKSGGASSLLREDAGGVGELIFSMLYNPWAAVVQFLGGLVVMAWVDWRLLLGALLLVPGVYYSDLTWNRRIRPLFRDVRKERQDIDSQTTEVFGGMRVVRAFGRQRSESARFMGNNHFMARLELHVWWLSRLIELLWEFILPMASVALLLYGGTQVIDGRLSMGDLMMFLVYLAMLLEPMAVLATSVTQFQNNLAGFDRVLDLLAERREMDDCPGNRPVVKHAVAGRITLRDVGFVYPGTSRPVLRDRPGCRVGRDDRPGGSERVGEDDALQPDRPILRPDPRHDRARWARPARDRGRELPTAAGDRRAGRLPVRRYDRREHRLRRSLGDAGSNRAGRPGGKRRRVHREAARRLRYLDRRARGAIERWSAATARHRPRRPGGPEDLHPRRGDQQPRQRKRTTDPAESRPASPGSYIVRHRPPPQHDPPRRPHPGAR